MPRAQPKPVALPEDAIQPRDAAAWRRWLETHHASGKGIWLVTFKKDSGRTRIDYETAVEEALCFGWIDSKPRALDAERSMLWFAPRKPKSGWSAPNKRRVEKLIAEGRMHAAGLAKVESAKHSGTWSALDAVEALEIPADLAKALSAAKPAAANFDAFPRSVKRGILEWIANAKKPETRAKRIEETATLAARNERANQWRGR
jgi:uncharacterized protein YdeI (YjbR/CyaY-like superfamily)